MKTECSISKHLICYLLIIFIMCKISTRYIYFDCIQVVLYNALKLCKLVREHLTRDQRPCLHPESLQILYIHSSMTVHLLFSSLTHCLQGSGQRTGHSRSLVLCSVTPFCVVFEVSVWIIVLLEDPDIAYYKISNRVSHLLIFYLLVFDIIHDDMCLNKMSRTSCRNIGPQHKKYSSIFNFTHGVLFMPVFTKPILNVCCQKNIILVLSDHRSQSHLKFHLCLISEYAGVCFWMSKDNIFFYPLKQHVVM